ncbi:uncharacterized protein LOC143934969 [Lithobates pipiens]
MENGKCNELYERSGEDGAQNTARTKQDQNPKGHCKDQREKGESLQSNPKDTATMTTTYSWTILIFMSLTFIVSTQSCKWLHRKQEVVNRQILQNFKRMIPAEDSPEVCLRSNFSIPDIKHLYQISNVESAAIAVREVANQTIQLYRRYGQKLDYHRPAWERLQELLYYQEQQLSDCIPEGAENQLFIQGISQQFITMQRILEEQGTVNASEHGEKGRSTKHLILFISDYSDTANKESHSVYRHVVKDL